MTIISKIYKFVRYVLLQRHIYGITSSMRVLPDCIVIGVGRSGTTSLYHYLGQHPCITKSAYDELGFFDDNYHLGVSWYRSMFPTKFHKKKIIKKFGKFMTYDVTPFYIYNQKVPKRIQETIPNSKIIVILRNPIDRAYSNYFLGKQEKKFEDIINYEKKIIDNIDKTDEKEYYRFVHSSLLARGFYAEQLEKWYKVFSKEQIFIIKSEEFANDTQKIMNDVFQFLELKNFNIQDTSKKNKKHYEPMKNETRKDLIEYFRPHNEKLYELIGRDFGWEI